MGISAVLFSITSVPAAASIYLHRQQRVTSSYIFGWVAASGLAVAIAALPIYASKTTLLLGKDPASGKVPLWSNLAFAPYHVGLRIKLWLTRNVFLTQEPLFTRVAAGWYIGGWAPAATDLPSTAKLSVLDVTAELPRTHQMRYLCLPVWDTRVPTLQQLDMGCDWALKEHARCGAVYIHCAHGHGRSAMLMAACLLESGSAASIDQAVALMQASRPLVYLNPLQRSTLEEWVLARQLKHQQETELVKATAPTGSSSAINLVATSLPDGTLTALVLDSTGDKQRIREATFGGAEGSGGSMKKTEGSAESAEAGKGGERGEGGIAFSLEVEC